MFDEAEIKKAVASIIKAIGEDPDREGLKNTPDRVADMYAELFMGVHMDAREELSIAYEIGHRELVVLKDIPFYSMCEHHLLPFYGMTHIGYLPDAVEDRRRDVGPYHLDNHGAFRAPVPQDIHPADVYSVVALGPSQDPEVQHCVYRLLHPVE